MSFFAAIQNEKLEVIIQHPIDNTEGWKRHIKSSNLNKMFEDTVFQKVLKNSACAIGNSSSFMRDSTFSGVPVVLVGNRQVGREHGKNLIESDFDEINLKRNIMLQLDHGKYSGADIYGDGNAAKKIVNHLINLKPDLQKMISYIDE